MYVCIQFLAPTTKSFSTSTLVLYKTGSSTLVLYKTGSSTLVLYKTGSSTLVLYKTGSSTLVLYKTGSVSGKLVHMHIRKPVKDQSRITAKYMYVCRQVNSYKNGPFQNQSFSLSTAD
ncbi:hypothetical protein V1264_021086 [Littorina saxatilis]|uniref:Uncharacterized protein n=1 Tax=Littorina saxatilis TaxID=31220 RepID=A0AAN9GBK3_9CAEN